MSQMQIRSVVVAAHLEEKRGIFQMCFTWKGMDGRRERKCKSTGLLIEGNQKIAEEMLEQTRLAIELELAASGVKQVKVTKAEKPIQILKEDDPFDVKGRLEKYRDILQMRLTWKGINGELCRKSFSTGLQDKRGNKKRAESMLKDKCEEIRDALALEAQEAAKRKEEADARADGDILFADYLTVWLDYVKGEVAENTYGGYQDMAKGVVEPYFREKKIWLKQLKVTDVTDFYEVQKKLGKKGNTSLHYRVVIAGALKYAGSVTQGLIEEQFHRLIPRPRIPQSEKFVPSFLRKAEIDEIRQALAGHKLELGFILGAYYGLRRSEVVGLRWPSVDLVADTITIEHIVVVTRINGKKVALAVNRTKSKSSRRTLPLIPVIKQLLLRKKKEQEYYKQICGNCYNAEGSVYVYTDQLGNRVNPDYLTRAFPEFLVKNNFRRVRFHDLRHSCASMLLAMGVSLKEIQDWLGHSEFSITADIYAHLEYQTKMNIANMIDWEGDVGTVRADPKPPPTILLRGMRKKKDRH